MCFQKYHPSVSFQEAADFKVSAPLSHHVLDHVLVFYPYRVLITKPSQRLGTWQPEAGNGVCTIAHRTQAAEPGSFVFPLYLLDLFCAHGHLGHSPCASVSHPQRGKWLYRPEGPCSNSQWRPQHELWTMQILQHFQTHGKKKVRMFDIGQTREHGSCALKRCLFAFIPLPADACVFTLLFRNRVG